MAGVYLEDLDSTPRTEAEKKIANPFTELKTDDKFVLFVNSEQPPNEIIPLDVYCYRGGPEINKIHFYRLCVLTYIQEGQIKHHRMDWEEVQVKEDYKLSLKQMCDLMSGGSAFLK